MKSTWSLSVTINSTDAFAFYVHAGHTNAHHNQNQFITKASLTAVTDDPILNHQYPLSHFVLPRITEHPTRKWILRLVT